MTLGEPVAVPENKSPGSGMKMGKVRVTPETMP
jgi:hypothetical protein